MNPITHALVSWVLLANARGETTRRERVIVTLGGLVPDIDGLGAVPDVATRWFTDSPTRFFHEYHHDLHTFWFAGLTTLVAAAAAEGGAARRAGTAALFCVAFHLHLLCDLVGSRGPDGSIWDVPYWRPLSQVAYAWDGQWRLDGWQNVTITVVLLLATAWFAVRRGRTIVEVVSTRADQAVVGALRARFGSSEA